MRQWQNSQITKKRNGKCQKSDPMHDIYIIVLRLNTGIIYIMQSGIFLTFAFLLFCYLAIVRGKEELKWG